VRRIQRAYENRFRALAETLGARRPEKALAWFRRRAKAKAAGSRGPEWRGWEEAWREAQARANRSPRRAGRFQERPPLRPEETRFRCDAGLGGLARWLRAGGYPAEWSPEMDDEELVRRAMAEEAVLATTDSLLMERRLVRDGWVCALWLPPALSPAQQLARTLSELGLPLLPPRCMRCGGRLVRRSKQELADRIPPRTFRWLEEFFVCEGCGGLFWKGTHWQRIERALAEAASLRDQRAAPPLRPPESEE